VARSIAECTCVNANRFLHKVLRRFKENEHNNLLNCFKLWLQGDCGQSEEVSFYFEVLRLCFSTRERILSYFPQLKRLSLLRKKKQEELFDKAILKTLNE
jgi:hypothetical protein